MLNHKNLLTTAFKGICLPVLTLLASIPTSLPIQAVTTSAKDYRLCAFQLLKLGISEENASKACSNALYPEDISACVIKIERQTKLAAQDVLNTCEKSRYPLDLAKCVNGISYNLDQEEAKPAVLDYCGRSLLPVRFANCVVGLRTEIKSEPVKAMDSCIDTKNLVINPEPSFIPAGQEQPKFAPTFETQPTPGTITPENPEQ